MKRLVMAPSLSAENTKIISHSMDMDRLSPPTDGDHLPLLGPALLRGRGRGGGVAAAQLQGQTRAHPGQTGYGRQQHVHTHLDRILAILPCSSPSASISASQLS